MIEPFEYEPKRLNAQPPPSRAGSQPIGGASSIDADMRFPSLKDNMSEVKLDMTQKQIYQTKIGNPAMENPSKAEFVTDRVVGQGPLVVSEEAPKEMEDASKMSSSELFSRVLDKDRYTPSKTMHTLPSMKVNSLSSPFMEPGLTTAYIHSITPNWAP